MLTNNPFEIALQDTVKALTALKAPKPINYMRPLASDFIAVRDFFVDVVAIVDAFGETIGHQVGENTSCPEFSPRTFVGSFSEGRIADAIYEIEACAGDVTEQRSAA